MPYPTDPHLRVPFSIRWGRADVIEGGTVDEIAQNVRVLLMTRPGQRPVVPEYGVEDPTFSYSHEALGEEVGAAVDRWEERAEIEIVYDPTDAGEGLSNWSVYVGLSETATGEGEDEESD